MARQNATQPDLVERILGLLLGLCGLGVAIALGLNYEEVKADNIVTLVVTLAVFFICMGIHQANQNPLSRLLVAVAFVGLTVALAEKMMSYF